MKRQILIAIFSLLYPYVLKAQDVIYLKDGMPVKVIIQEVTPEKVRFKKVNDPEGSNYSYKKENILMLVTNNGRYLVMSELDEISVDPNSITSQVNNTLATPAVHVDHIFLMDKSVKGTIIQNGDPVVIKTTSGRTESIASSEIVSVIYADGTHKIFSSIADAAMLMAKYRNVPKEAPLGNSSSNKSENSQSASLAIAYSNGNMDDIDMGELGIVTFKEYSERAVARVTRFVDYIKVIANKTVGSDDKKKAIQGAVSLFISENSRIQVSSLKSNQTNVYKVKEYLVKVRTLGYDKVEVESTNVQYVSKLTKQADGNYSGVVSFEQKFKGFRDGRVVYEDKTIKTAVVIVTVSKDIKDGVPSLLWDVFISDIGVVETQK